MAGSFKDANNKYGITEPVTQHEKEKVDPTDGSGSLYDVIPEDTTPIAIIHNHPGGQPKNSSDDIDSANEEFGVDIYAVTSSREYSHYSVITKTDTYRGKF